MKKLYTLMIAVLITANVWAQSPNKMSYQAVVRDANNELVSDADIGMQISILQGSADGSSVYTETQIRTSNGNGLVSVEIGMGNTSDDFSAIDWAAGPYFIKTETDPAGGTNYTITGTSQLMSVPYALYAETSGSSIPGPAGPQGLIGLPGVAGATGPQGPAGVDGVGIAQTLSQSGNDITLSDGGGTVTITDTDTQLDAAGVTALGFVSGAHTVDTDTQLDETAVDTFVANNGYLTTEIDGSITNEIELPTSANIGDMTYWNGTAWVAVTGATEGAIMQFINRMPTWIGSLPAIGDYRHGGVIFWLDYTGKHGLVCAISEQYYRKQWYNNGTRTVTGATGTAIGTGQSNTATIVASQGAGSYAAQFSNDLVLNGYSDWFLPSQDELNEMYLKKAAINATALANGGVAFAGIKSDYWSSTEIDDNTAWLQSMGGGQGPGPKDETYYVRAVRAF